MNISGSVDYTAVQQPPAQPPAQIEKSKQLQSLAPAPSPAASPAAPKQAFSQDTVTISAAAHAANDATKVQGSVLDEYGDYR